MKGRCPRPLDERDGMQATEIKQFFGSFLLWILGCPDIVHMRLKNPDYILQGRPYYIVIQFLCNITLFLTKKRTIQYVSVDFLGGVFDRPFSYFDM